jgi:hypothetical protein
VDDAVEDLGPNGGDANGDDIPDRLQANVVSLPNAVDGGYVALFVEGGLTLAEVGAMGISDGGAPPLPFTYPVGFFTFRISGLDPGGSAVVRLILPPGTSIRSYAQHLPATEEAEAEWLEFAFDGETGARIDGETIALYLIDGGRGDADREANGAIVDLGAPAALINASATFWTIYR